MIQFVDRSLQAYIFAGALMMTACGGGESAPSRTTGGSSGTSTSSGAAIPTDTVDGPNGSEPTKPPGTVTVPPDDLTEPPGTVTLPSGKVDAPTGMTAFTGCNTEGVLSLVDLLNQPADGLGVMEQGLLVSKLWDPRLGFTEGLVPGREYTISLAIRPTSAASALASLSVLTGNCVENPPGMLNRELVSLASMETMVTNAEYQLLTHTFVYDGPQAAEQNLNAVLLVGMGPDAAFLVDDLTIVDTATGQLDINSSCYADPVELLMGLDSETDGTRYELYLPAAENGLVPGQQYSLSLPVSPVDALSTTIDLAIIGMTCDKSIGDAPLEPPVSRTKHHTVFAAEQFELSGEARQSIRVDFVYDGPRIQSNIPSGLIVVTAPAGVELTLGEFQLSAIQ